MIQIKGCPFCGSSTVIVESKKVRCISCEASVPGRDQEEAIRKWNGRIVSDLLELAYYKGVEACVEGFNKENAGYKYLSSLDGAGVEAWIDGYKRAYEARYNIPVKVEVIVGCSESTVTIDGKNYIDKNE